MHRMMSSSETLKYQLPSKDKIRLPALTEPRQEIHIDFSGNLHNKHVTVEPHIFVRVD